MPGGSLSSCGEVLAVFQGPHAYVVFVPWRPNVELRSGSPSREPRLIESETDLEALLERLTHVHESHMPSPWKPNLTGERRTKLLSMVVGFEIEITDIQAKFKLSQNLPYEDQQNVVEKLGQSSNQTEVSVAKLMSGVLHAEL